LADARRSRYASIPFTDGVYQARPLDASRRKGVESRR
jgi:hypothetical protein